MSSTAAPLRVGAVVLDIEGTTGSAAHVHDVLFPYARERFAQWFADHRDSRLHTELVSQIGDATGEPGLDEARAVKVLTEWTDADLKAAPLKVVQSRIWAAGYADGTLEGHVYDDVPAALTRWARAGIARYIYSSGAEGAQRNWFAHSGHGDLTGLLDGYFDLASAGGKREPESYRAITRAIGVPPAETVFLSDVVAELDAATAAGWHTVGVVRDSAPHVPHVPHTGGHPWISSLDQVSLEGPDTRRPGHSANNDCEVGQA
ncbi:acireductone synthase [Streptomyces sp. NPDC004647]|uniref:acireductone synthase n=1 Tax=Streptomyces sp. NPDC004647 TaxID=3154671 RepID=UPI0033A8128D